MGKIKQIRIKRVRSAASGVQGQTNDSENPPLRADEIRSLKPIASIKRIRWQLGLSQDEFARRFEIPIGTLRDWEQGRSQPDRPARAYLKLISSNPAFVSRSLQGDETSSTRAVAIAAKALTNPKAVTVAEVRILAASALTQRSSLPKSRKKTKRPASSV
ncbi:MAG: helix-turn-helix domain-containing protein [Hyphomicrobium sp.]|nr:helix-turn-helix domain-containing protein [Hyphomicrobium sp.]